MSSLVLNFFLSKLLFVYRDFRIGSTLSTRSLTVSGKSNIWGERLLLCFSGVLSRDAIIVNRLLTTFHLWLLVISSDSTLKILAACLVTWV